MLMIQGAIVKYKHVHIAFPIERRSPFHFSLAQCTTRSFHFQSSLPVCACVLLQSALFVCNTSTTTIIPLSMNKIDGFHLCTQTVHIEPCMHVKQSYVALHSFYTYHAHFALFFLPFFLLYSYSSDFQ